MTVTWPARFGESDGLRRAMMNRVDAVPWVGGNSIPIEAIPATVDQVLKQVPNRLGKQ